MNQSLIVLAAVTLSVVCGDTPRAFAQEPPPHDHQHPAADAASGSFPSREASGTAWLPDETPMYGIHRTWAGWQAMLHGSVFAQWLHEPGDIHRTGGFSESQWSSANWAMLMARRAAGRGRIGLRAMASVEPWTARDCGFINLLASGEMCEGDTIHDRQHPHDLIMELVAEYERPIGASLRWHLYGGPAAEPALGPAAFLHRASAASNPVAPIAHHWFDATHIAFGVITTGVSSARWRAEASAFNGREPDEQRTDLDLAPLDSFSGRLTFLPTPRLALQVSAGHLREAEAEFAPNPRSDVVRATASVSYHRLTDRRIWATTFAYGFNAGSEHLEGFGDSDLRTSAGLIETSLTLDDRHAWFGRAELVQKPAHDLHAHEWLDRVFAVGKLQAGYARYLTTRGGSLGLGGFASANLVPPELTNRYLRRVAPGFGVFVTVRPSRH